MRPFEYLACLVKALLLLAVVADSVSPYAIPIHYRLPDVLLQEPSIKFQAALPDQAGLDRFRLEFYKLARASPRFQRRYPSPGDFNSQAFKEFLGMSALNPALGFDDYDAVETTADKQNPNGPVRPGIERTLLDWIRIGSLYPDLDHRNRDRWWVVGNRIQRAADGERIPYDPVVLNMGRMEGLSSQAHAHYGLNPNPKSDDPEVLKKRPADFAVRAGFPQAPVLTFAPERAQAYGDLSFIAARLRQPALAALFAGNAFHYLADVANQIHTIQVGIYDFFVDATLQAWKLKLLRLGGLLGPTLERNQIGIDIIANHHSWSEELFRFAFERALSGKPFHPALSHVDRLFVPDPQFLAAWAEISPQGSFFRELAGRIIVAGNAEGPEIYALTRQLSKNDLRQAGVKVNFDNQPDGVVLSYLQPTADAGKLTRFFELERTGFMRAATALSLCWRSQFSRSGSIDIRKAADRLLQQQLDELEAADARRKIFVDLHGGPASGSGSAGSR